MRRPFPQGAISLSRRVSLTFHSDTAHTIAFSVSFIVVALRLGSSLRDAINVYTYPYEHSTRRAPNKDIATFTLLLIAFWGLIWRRSWLVWRRNPSIPRGINLLLQVGEIGIVMWSVLMQTCTDTVLWNSRHWMEFPSHRLKSDIFTLCLLYMPACMYLLVAMILEAIRVEGGIGLAFRTPSPPRRNKTSGRMSSIQPRLVIVKLYLVVILAYIASLVLVVKPAGTEIIGEDPSLLLAENGHTKFIALVALGIHVIHHLLGFFVVSALPRGLDFGLILFEHLVLNLAYKNDYVPLPALIILNLSEQILASLLLAYRIWDIVEYGASLRESFNFVPSYGKHSSRMALLLGRNAWENLSLRGEPGVVKAVRGILAIAALGGLCIFSGVLISRDVSSSQEEILLKTFTLNKPKAILDISFVHFILLTTPDPSAASVLLEHPEILQITQTCTFVPDIYTCPPCSLYPSTFTGIGSFQYHGCWSCFQNSDYKSDSCQVQIQVDFERGVEVGAFSGPDFSQFLYVNIVIDGVDNTTVWKIPKITLRRNRALEGDVLFYQYEFIRQSGLTLLGFGKSDQALVGDIKSISNDPTYTIPNNLSYLKYQYSPINDVVSTGVREYTDKTVLDAFAAIGGIWTFGNGLFALLFGGSLLYFLLGIRPLSRFGFIHLFIRARLRKATREQYPNFHREGGQPGEAEAGVVSFIRHHLLGVVEDDEESERKERRAAWERQRDEMELLSFEVSHPLEGGSQHTRSTGYQSLQQKDEESAI